MIFFLIGIVTMLLSPESGKIGREAEGHTHYPREA